jgi:hypothetical protein
VQLIAEGRGSKEVGEKLGISLKTAETHRANIMRKLDIHSVSELVRYAVNNQIIEAWRNQVGSLCVSSPSSLALSLSLELVFVVSIEARPVSCES